MTSPSDLDGIRVGQRTAAHLNLKFSMADMARIEDMARRKLAPEDMVWELELTGLKATPSEIARLLRRNGFSDFGSLGGR